ncbi:segregation/condensation protein A [bacterium]|nr:segregation/condensation protein A [bacterium]
MQDYVVSLEQFTGPLDLLLHLIRVSELDLLDLDVGVITAEYLTFIEAHGVKDLAQAYQFLAMAATLVELKSRLLLPGQPGETEGEEAVDSAEDQRQELIRRLVAYRGIQEVTGELQQRFEQTGRHWPRQAVEKMEAEIVYTMESLSVYDLMNAFQEILQRPRFKQISIFKDDYDVDQARDWVSAKLEEGPSSLEEILGSQPNVFWLVVTFIALLELIKDERAGFERREGQIAVYATFAQAPI